ncbi:Thioredoxin fold domain-containing protein [Penicillium ucsense]|uniref:Thioredoxin fold domain-containing protein n=1 Tax=Penicillium ucsense TaxID=2839758 RepID=A0A8J8VZK1_9EURO|nr:Thioredoxin fold domain-containing protein [Penicillium ucsense]KAF7737038.1 Thioredoxin fold domain-containing protein [Penicillium ucsense]
MKFASLGVSLISLLAVPSLASLSDFGASINNRLEKRRSNRGVDAEDPSIFNGLDVPPLFQLTPENFEESIKDGTWLVKHYSPSCAHCRKAAPAYQTTYEFYYTSNPISPSSLKSPDPKSLNGFTSYYNFHFASMNCLAHGDFCNKLGISAWPTFAFYEGGIQKDTHVGAKSIADLSKLIEEKLEATKPGSRPPQGIKLPEVGASSVDSSAEPDSPVAKDKDPKAGALAGERHNDEAAQKNKEVPKPVESSKPDSPATVKTKPVGPAPNPQGMSVPLTAESFQKLVTTTRDPWFIKFYAPWCGHCQAMAPSWRQMAKEMKDTLNVGEVNCEIETRLCADARVNAFPTLYFFRGGQRVEYTGLRGLGDLLSYAKKAVGPGSEIQDVDAATFKELEETEEVLFLYFYDEATTSEDFRAMDRLTLSLVGHARIVKTSSGALAERFKISTWPRLLVVRDGRPNYYNALAPKDMRDFRQILSWMQSVWLPIVPELTAANAREIMDGKFVVLGILSRRRNDDFKQSRRELKEAAFEWMDKQIQLFRLERSELRDAKQLRIEEADDRNDQRALRAAKNMRITIREDDKKPVAFAWVDGDFWERWLRTTYGIDVEHGDRVIINDEDNRRYWDTASSGAPIMASRTSILETIPLVIASPPKLSSKSTTGTIETFFFFTRTFISSHPILFFIFLGLSVAAVTFIGRGRLLRRVTRGGIIGNSNSNGGFFHLDGKEGLLNGGSTGKVD